MVILRKLAFRVQSNLGAHPSKIKNAASLLETTFESFNFHSDMWVRNELHAPSRLRWAQASLRLLELALVFVRLNHVAIRILNTNHCNHVTGCDASRSRIALLTAFGSPYHNRPNGRTSEIRSTPR